MLRAKRWPAMVGNRDRTIVEELLTLLPHPPQRTLLFGQELDPLLTAAQKQDRSAVGVCSKPVRYDQTARPCLSAGLPAVSSWESLNLEDKGYGAIVFHYPTPRLDPLVLFGKAYRALEEGGILVLVDEIAIAVYRNGDQGPARLPCLRSLGERCGFELQDQQILSTPEGQQSDPLNTPMLLRFTKRSQLRWRVSHVDPRDFPAVADLFKRVFGHEISAELWDWKYGKGRGQESLAWAGERLIAHYGGITRRVRYFDRVEKACQVADVMVDQAERGVLTRKGPFFLTAASFPEACVGFGSKHLIGYGFPNHRHMQIAARLGLYAEVGRIVEVYWTPESPPSFLFTGVRRITGGEHGLEGIVEPLWRAMSADLSEAIIGIRDSQWLGYRYLGHPHHDYQVLLIFNRLTRKSQGIMVLRKEGERCELLDVIAPLNNIPNLIRQARRIARQWEVSELYCWISTSYASLFLQCAGQQRDPDVAIPTSIWTDGPSPDEMRNRWWLMSGDTDFH